MTEFLKVPADSDAPPLPRARACGPYEIGRNAFGQNGLAAGQSSTFRDAQGFSRTASVRHFAFSSCEHIGGGGMAQTFSGAVEFMPRAAARCGAHLAPLLSVRTRPCQRRGQQLARQRRQQFITCPLPATPPIAQNLACADLHSNITQRHAENEKLGEAAQPHEVKLQPRRDSCPARVGVFERGCPTIIPAMARAVVFRRVQLGPRLCPSRRDSRRACRTGCGFFELMREIYKIAVPSALSLRRV